MYRQITAKQRIADTLEREIHDGSFEDGDRLPGEVDLAKRFEVSRTTIRQALADLGRKGLIETRVGSGSYITFDGRELDERRGWAYGLRNAGLEVVSRVIQFGAVEDAALAERLSTGSQFIALDRLRLLNGHRPISLERSRIPLDDRTRPLLDIDFSRTSLDRALRDVGSVGHTSEDEIEVRGLSTADAALLDRSIGEPFLLSRRVIKSSDDGVVEYVASLLDAEHFRFRIKVHLRQLRIEDFQS